MAVMNTKRGVALLITVIFMSVMLAFGLALASLAFKQSVLASTASQSQVAFYAADAALECALYADQQQGAYFYSDYSASTLPDAVTLAAYAATACDGTVSGTPTAGWASGADGRLSLSERISFNADKSCADITVYKYATPRTGGQKGFIFSTGYNVPCATLSVAGIRIVARGIYEKY